MEINIVLCPVLSAGGENVFQAACNNMCASLSKFTAHTLHAWSLSLFQGYD